MAVKAGRLGSGRGAPDGPPKRKSDRFLVTIGTFDGVHLGHRQLIAWVALQARALGMRTRVVFFVEPPRFHFQPDLSVPLLTTSRDRRAIIKSLGIERVEVLRFGSRWAEMSSARFFDEYIVRRWKAGGLLVGKDFVFGKGRTGDLKYLKEACRPRGMRLGVLPLVRVEGRKISSSRIRSLLLAGKVERAALMLGRPHSVSGSVVRGRGLGGRIGVPTANVRTPAEALAPPGVFLVRVSGEGIGAGLDAFPEGARHGAPAGVDAAPDADAFPEGARHGAPAGVDAVCNVGTRPTVRVAGRPKRTVEVHIPGFSGELYGKTLRVEFLRRLRGERSFPSLEALRRAIRRDIRRCQASTFPTY
ncbi:MAG: riboflavin kinase [Elusimicrobiota bacterium]